MLFAETSDGVSYLYEYYPVRYAEHKGISEMILAFKDDNSKAIEDFTLVMKQAMDEKFHGREEELKNTIICIMPSHETEHYSKGLLIMAEYLARAFGMIKGTDLIKRVRYHEKISRGGDRSIQGQLNTIEINKEYNVLGKNILILDDVSTSGNSIEAVRILLRPLGVRSIYAQTIGKTHSDYKCGAYSTYGYTENNLQSAILNSEGLTTVELQEDDVFTVCEAFSDYVPYLILEIEDLIKGINACEEVRKSDFWKCVIEKNKRCKIKNGDMSQDLECGKMVLCDIHNLIGKMCKDGIISEMPAEIIYRRIIKTEPDSYFLIGKDFNISRDQARRITSKEYYDLLLLIKDTTLPRVAPYKLELRTILNGIPDDLYMPIKKYIKEKDELLYWLIDKISNS